MARGWESKSVESQIEAAEERAALAKLTKLTAEESERKQQRESLLLSRTRVMRDLETSKNPRSRASLEAALKHLDDKIATLNVMLRLLCCAILRGSAMAQQFHIDHVTVAGKDLKAMTEALRKVTGITAEYGGPHSNHATEMALASFPDGSYLELIAIQPNADPAALAAHYWHKFLEADGGPCAWAIRPPDIQRRSGTAAQRGRRRDRSEQKWTEAS